MNSKIVSEALNSQVQISENPYNKRVFQNLKDKNFLFSKSQKIATAIYLVSNFLPQNDPLRISLRNSAVDLLSLIGQVVFSGHSDLQKVISKSRATAGQIISMLEIAFYTGYISEMNLRVIKGELEVFTDNDKAFSSAIKDNLVLPELGSEYFGPTFIKDNQKGRGKGQKISAKRPENKVKLPPSLNESSPVFARKQSRKDKIVEILQKNKGSVTVKDISQVISDCSEKTLQRELIFLVKTGVLKKEGQRRWSTYSLLA